MTPFGYATTVENEEAVKILLNIWCIEDTFAFYWSLKCLSALLLPRPFAAERDEQFESENKRILLGQRLNLPDTLVQSMLGNERSNSNTEGDIVPAIVSDLILMVVSNIVESILCSHRDTTEPDHFSRFIAALAKGYQVLLTLLQTPTLIIIENAVLLLRVLTAHSPDVESIIHETSLTLGILLDYFYHAIFSPGEGQRFFVDIFVVFGCLALWNIPRSNC